jgi:hypothetical protein
MPRIVPVREIYGKTLLPSRGVFCMNHVVDAAELHDKQDVSNYYQLRDRNDIWDLVLWERHPETYAYKLVYELAYMDICPDFDF